MSKAASRDTHYWNRWGSRTRHPLEAGGSQGCGRLLYVVECNLQHFVPSSPDEKADDHPPVHKRDVLEMSRRN